MTTAALVAQPIVFALILWIVLRHQQHTHDRHQAALTALTDRFMDQARADRDNQQNLLQRIQAPEVAVYQHDQTPPPAEQSFPLDDEALAKLQDQERAKALAQVEEMEAEMAVL